MRNPDRAYTDPRLAVLYDDLDGDRDDLNTYLAIADELGAHSVVDIGCGTGCLALDLAASGRSVVAVDPAQASLDVARAKPLADRVTWVHGDATVLAGLDVVFDLATMTGNVAQVFVADSDWSDTLAAVRACLRPGGWFVFETRRPEARDWGHWDFPPREVTLLGGASVVTSRTVTDVALPLVSFESTTTVDGEILTSQSTLRFRERPAIERDLAAHGFSSVEVRDAPDRPGKEMVFVAQVAGTGEGRTRSGEAG